MGLFGPPNVDKMKAARDVKGLVKALGYIKDEQVRKAAADALVELGAGAVDELARALKGAGWGVCQAIAEVLGRIGDVRAVEPLLSVLKVPTWWGPEEWAVVEALGVIGDARAFQPIVGGLKDEDWHVRHAVASALGGIGDARAVQPLIDALKDADSNVRAAAAEALGRIGDARAVEPLIEKLRDEASKPRDAARIALGAIGQPALEPLLAALGSQDWTKPSGANRVLTEIGARNPMRLAFALGASQWGVRRFAATALVNLYRSDRLDSGVRQGVLAQRGTITQPHDDRPATDRHICGSSEHDDEPHTDSGIGVVFEL